MARQKEKLLTADDLLRLDSGRIRGELIQGALCETMPAGVRHGHIVVNLTILLGGFIKPRRFGWILASEVGFLLERDPDTVRAPDIAYISASRLPLDADVPGYYGAPLTWQSRLSLPATGPGSSITKPACGSASARRSYGLSTRRTAPSKSTVPISLCCIWPKMTRSTAARCCPASVVPCAACLNSRPESFEA